MDLAVDLAAGCARKQSSPPPYLALPCTSRRDISADHHVSVSYPLLCNDQSCYRAGQLACATTPCSTPLACEAVCSIMPSFTMMDMWRERRRARRKNRRLQVPLQGSFLAVGFCGLAVFASFAARGPDGQPAFARVDAIRDPWAHFHLGSEPPGTAEGDAIPRRRLHDEPPPSPPLPSAPPPAIDGATCGSAFEVSTDTGFPDLWETQRTDEENLRMAFFQVRRTGPHHPRVAPTPTHPLAPTPPPTPAHHHSSRIRRSFYRTYSPTHVLAYSHAHSHRRTHVRPLANCAVLCHPRDLPRAGRDLRRLLHGRPRGHRRLPQAQGKCL